LCRAELVRSHFPEHLQQPGRNQRPVAAGKTAVSADPSADISAEPGDESSSSRGSRLAGTLLRQQA